GRGSPVALGDLAYIHAACAHRGYVGIEIVALHDEKAQAAAPRGELDEAAPGVSARVLIAVADRDQLEVVLFVEGDGVVRALPGMLAAGLHAESEPRVRVDAPVELRDRDHHVVDTGEAHGRVRLLRLDSGAIDDGPHALQAVLRPLRHRLRRRADRLEALRDQLVAHVGRADRL